MPEEQVSVDTLLERQGRLRVTVEPVPESDEQIRVTPLTPGNGCSCDRSLVIPKREIEGVITTDDVRNCCGKRLTVVEVLFTSDTLTSVFQQLSASASKARRAPAAARPVRTVPVPVNAGYSMAGPPVADRRPGLVPRTFPAGSAPPMPVMYVYDDWYVRCSDAYDQCKLDCDPESLWCGFECLRDYDRCVAEGLDKHP